MSNEEYQSRPELSQSTAKEMIFSSPAHVKHARDNPPDERPAYFDIGSMTHTTVLEPANLDAEYVRIPEEIDGCGPRTKTYREALANMRLEQPSMRFLKAPDYDLCLDMGFALLANPVVSYHLSSHGALVEKSGFFDFDGCACRIRPDLLCPEEGVVIDLKTTSGSASKRGFTSSVRKFGYDFQACFYRAGLRALGYPIRSFIFAVVERAPPHAVGVYSLSGSDIDAQMGRMRDACALWKYCNETNCWPGYPEDVIHLDLSPQNAGRRLSMSEIERKHAISKYITAKIAKKYGLRDQWIGNRRTFDESDFLDALRMHYAGAANGAAPPAGKEEVNEANGGS